MMKRGSYVFLLFLIAAYSSMPVCVQAQSNVEVFGQNRIQHRKFDWKFFDTKHFRVYHYDKAGRDLGRYVAEEAENNITVVEKKLGGQFPHRFNIILYNSYDEYRQSNVGLKDDAQDIGNARAGSLNLVGDKLVVYFTGQHTDLRHQIRSGMARVVMQRMIFGESFKKMVKNALLLNLPQWVTDGYIAYLVDGWDAKSNSEWKGLLEARPNDGFHEISEQYPELAGKAFWKFVSNQYGPDAVKNLLYAMQQKTGLNKALKDSTGVGLRMKVTKAYDSCLNYYKGVYAWDAQHQEQPDSAHGLIALKVPKDNSVIRNIRVSPNGNDVCYVAWKEGRFTVYSQKTAGEQKLTPLLEGGRKDLTEEVDPNYPMIAWSNTGHKFAILYKKNHQTILRIYNSLRGRIENIVIPAKRFDRVLSFSFTQDDDKMVFSAIKKSQTDLYMFTIKGAKMVNITDDLWDDVAPEFISGGSRTGILFLSNRPKPNLNVPLAVNELPTGPMNVFFLNTRTMRPELLQCSDVKKGHVSQPIQYGLDHFAYLYDSSGITNKYVVLFARNAKNEDSAYSVPITNYSTSILSHQYNPASGDVADVVQEGDKYRVYFHDLQMPGQNVAVKSLVPTTLSREREAPKRPAAVPVTPATTAAQPEQEEEPEQPLVKQGTVFQTEFSDTTARRHRRVRKAAAQSAKADSSLLTVVTDSAYLNMKPSPYRLNFRPDFFAIKLDNSILFSQYQSINANGGQFENQSLSGLTTISLNDVLENHRITAGFQLPVQQPMTATYFLQYQNFSRRLDWGFTGFRRKTDKGMRVVYYDANNIPVLEADQLFKSVSTLVQGDISYPLDRVRSIRFHTGVRQDKLVQKVIDTLSLAFDIPNNETYTSMSRLEYVFDNTITPAMNISLGTKFKVYGDFMYGLNKDRKTTYVLGADVRNYQKLYKNIILANRFAYAYSGGTAKVQYLLGGVDNWMPSPQKDGRASQAGGPEYGFQALVTSLRGYKQYARMGSSFAVLTTEVRVPVITAFFHRPIKSPLLKNLQLVGFADVGAGWKGLIPTADSMAQQYTFPNPVVFGQPNNVWVTINQPSPVAVGYGAGLRSSLFGYFVRMDVAWNIEGLRRPMLYFALGYDF